jgi:hypothetical protein
VAPALPPGWTSTTNIACANSTPWVTNNGTFDTPPNSASTNDPDCVSDEWLTSINFPINSPTAQLTFRRSNNLENTFDGMVLEISINGGAFADILTAGGSFVTGGYNGTISVNFGSPIAGRQAWTGNSGGFVTTTVNLPAAANGFPVKLRWRRASDSSVGATGAFIDGISITGCSVAPPIPVPCSGTSMTFTNTTPVTISTGAPSVVTSTITVSGAPTYLYRLILTTFITHTFNADLDITIKSPSGTVVTLTTDNGSSFDDVFNGTVWDDKANPGGQVPYTTNNGLVTDQVFANSVLASPLAPEEPLSAFVGENPNGVWTLMISDDLSGDGGALNSW